MTEQKLRYKNLIQEHDYAKLFLSTLISRFGDSIDVIAFSWLVYQITGSPVWLAVLFGVNSIPTILLQPLAGVAVERKDKKRILVATDFGRGLCVLLIALLYLFECLNPWLLMTITFLNSTFEAFRIPAGLAIYPQILPKEKYTQAISLNNSASRIMEIAGMACAGVIIGGLGIGGAIMIDAATFLTSAMILCFMKTPRFPYSCDAGKISGFRMRRRSRGTVTESGEVESKETEAGVEGRGDRPETALRGFAKEFMEGIRYLRTFPLLFLLCFINCVINGLLVPLNSFQTAYISSTLHLGALALSVSSASMSVGLSMGALLYPRLCVGIRKISLLCLGGLLSCGMYIAFPLLAAVELPQLLWLLMTTAFLLFGLSISMIIMTVSVLFMKNTEDRYLARVGGIFNSMAMAAIPFVSFICAALAKYLSVSAIFAGAGVIGIAFFAVLYFNRTLRSLRETGNNGQAEAFSAPEAGEDSCGDESRPL